MFLVLECGGIQVQDKELLTLFKMLSEETYITSDRLSEQMKLGMRTVRKRMKDLNDLLTNHGASVESKPRYGYRLLVQNKGALEAFIDRERVQEDGKEEIPSSNEERVSYLLAYLLNRDEYVKAEMLMDFLYISKGTLTSSLKQVELIIEPYGLKLERRPNYGMRVVGREFDIRRCMGEFFSHNGLFRELDYKRQSGELAGLARIIMDCAGAYGIRFSEAVFERFVNDIYIQIRRMRGQHYVGIPIDDLRGLNKAELGFAEEMQQELSGLYNLEFPENEKMYIALHLAGKRMVGCPSGNELNFVIQESIDQLAVNMLEAVYEQSGIDLRGNFELRMSLNQHMVPLDIRLRYDMPLSNSMLDEIKEKYMMGYNMAVLAASVLSTHYGKSVSEDEIGYLALIFALALEQMDITEEVKKSRILIVCNSGKGISRLLMYRFQQVFSKYIKQIYVSSLLELEYFDYSKVDYVFTTVPITEIIPVPIQEVGLFLEEKDLLNVRKVLESGCKGYLIKAYSSENFFPFVSGDTREEVLREICTRVYGRNPLPDGLYESVMERELLCSTDFGNQVAIPHPNRIMTDETFIYVAVLEKPIMWSRYPVQVVMLMIMGRMEGKELQDFYEMTTRFIADKAAISRLIETRDYDTLAQGLIKQIGV